MAGLSGIYTILSESTVRVKAVLELQAEKMREQVMGNAGLVTNILTYWGSSSCYEH